MLAPDLVLGVKSFALAGTARNPSNQNPELIYYTAFVVAVPVLQAYFLTLFYRHKSIRFLDDRWFRLISLALYRQL